MSELPIIDHGIILNNTNTSPIKDNKNSIYIDRKYINRSFNEFKIVNNKTIVILNKDKEKIMSKNKINLKEFVLMTKNDLIKSIDSLKSDMTKVAGVLLILGAGTFTINYNKINDLEKNQKVILESLKNIENKLSNKPTS